MKLKFNLAVLLICVVAFSSLSLLLLPQIPEASASSSASNSSRSVQIGGLQYTESVSYGSAETVHVDVNVIYQGFNQSQYGVLPWGYKVGDSLLVWLKDEETRTYINGTDVAVTGDPYACAQWQEAGKGLAWSLCGLSQLPNGNGTENVHFEFSASHAPASPSWLLQLGVIVVSNNMAGNVPLVLSDLAISVVGATAATASQPSAAPLHTTSQPSESKQLLELAFIVAGIVGLAALLTYSIRKKQSETTPTANLKMSCLQV